METPVVWQVHSAALAYRQLHTLKLAKTFFLQIHLLQTIVVLKLKVGQLPVTLLWLSCYCTRLRNMPCPSYPTMPARSEVGHVPTPSSWPRGEIRDLEAFGTIRSGPEPQSVCPGSIPQGIPCPLPSRSTQPRATTHPCCTMADPQHRVWKPPWINSVLTV